MHQLCEASIRYCNAILSRIGEPRKSFREPKDVLRLIDPVSLSVDEPQDPSVPVIDLELNCEWEEEHGMQWLVRENKVLYVGEFAGQDPWSDFTEKDEWNFA